MSDESNPVSVLPQSDCWNLLSSVTLGRLVTSVDGTPLTLFDIVPPDCRQPAYQAFSDLFAGFSATTFEILWDAEDGVHFEREGGDMIAREVLKALNRVYDLTSWRRKAE